MNRKYSDDELISALNTWLQNQRAKIKNEEQRKKIHQVFSIKQTLKNIKKDIKKQSKNTKNDWNLIWKNVVGKEIEEYTQVKRWHNGFLEIIVDNPILRSELDAFYKNSLIETLREYVEDKKILRGIKFISS